MNLPSIVSPDGLGLNLKGNLALEPVKLDGLFTPIGAVRDLFAIPRTHSKHSKRSQHKKNKNKSTQEDPEVSLPIDSKTGKENKSNDSKNTNINNITINIGETSVKNTKTPPK